MKGDDIKHQAYIIVCVAVMLGIGLFFYAGQGKLSPSGGALPARQDSGQTGVPAAGENMSRPAVHDVALSPAEEEAVKQTAIYGVLLGYFAVRKDDSGVCAGLSGEALNKLAIPLVQ